MANVEFPKLVFRDNLAMGLPISTPMLLEVLCFICVSEMPRLKSYDQACTLATGTIFCRALESILSSSSSDPGVCQVSISVTVTNILN